MSPHLIAQRPNVSLRLRIASYEDEAAATLDAILAHLATVGAVAGAGAVAAAVEAVLAPDEAGSSEQEQHAPQQPRSTAPSTAPDPAVTLVSERTRGKRKQRS